GPLCSVELLRHASSRQFARIKGAVRLLEIGVRNHGVEGFFRAARHPVAHARAALDLDLAHGTRQAELTAELLEQPNQRTDQGAGPPTSEEHAPLALQVVNQRVNRAGLEGVTAD